MDIIRKVVGFRGSDAEVQMQKCRSLMYNKNNSGPRTEPWGTPRMITYI